MIPDWISEPIREFGRAAGLADFALDERGAAAIRFETGWTLRFEYQNDTLAIVMTVPAAGDPATVRTILAYANPMARRAVRIRCGWRSKTSRAIFVVRLASREVTSPLLSAAFSELWSIASEFAELR